MSIGFHRRMILTNGLQLYVLILLKTRSSFKRLSPLLHGQYSTGVKNTDVHLVRDKYWNDIMRDKSDIAVC